MKKVIIVDKNQKNLIQTYIRKRNIASENNDEYNQNRHKTYEIIYFLNNNIDIDLSNLYEKQIVEIIMRYPQLVEKISSENINKVSAKSLIQIIRAHPELKHNEYLEIRNSDIAGMITIDPDMVDFYDINKLDGNEIAGIITKQPQMIGMFDLNKLDGNHHNVRIIATQPQLIDKIDISGISVDMSRRLLTLNPDLQPYFDKLKQNG